MGNRTKRWRIITISAVVVLIVALALPISNLLIGRKYLPVAAGDGQFQRVSMTLQKSCGLSRPRWRAAADLLQLPDRVVGDCR